MNQHPALELTSYYLGTLQSRIGGRRDCWWRGRPYWCPQSSRPPPIAPLAFPFSSIWSYHSWLTFWSWRPTDFEWRRPDEDRISPWTLLCRRRAPRLSSRGATSGIQWNRLGNLIDLVRPGSRCFATGHASLVVWTVADPFVPWMRRNSSRVWSITLHGNSFRSHLDIGIRFRRCSLAEQRIYQRSWTYSVAAASSDSQRSLALQTSRTAAPFLPLLVPYLFAARDFACRLRTHWSAYLLFVQALKNSVFDFSSIPAGVHQPYQVLNWCWIVSFLT